MQFAQPDTLYALLLVPLALLFLFWAERRRRTDLARLGETVLIEDLSASLNRRGRTAKTVLRIAALALLVVALARPQWGTHVQMVEQKGVQVMFALDVSPSMLAQDVKPDRLGRAKLIMTELMDALEDDEIGLVLFSGSSFLQFPLTTDSSTARSLIDAARPESISRRGTAIGEAIETAIRSYNTKRASARVLVIFSDGEDHAGNSLESARKAAEQEVRIYTIGVGTPQGAPVPVTDEGGGVSGFLKDGADQVVVSRLDESFLQSLSQTGGGQYYRAGALGTEVSALAAEIEAMQKAELEKRFSRQPLERFQIFLAGAVLCLLATELIPERRRNASSGLFRRGVTSAALLLVAVQGLSACSPSAASLNRAANQAYAKQDYDAARRGYESAAQAAPQAPEPPYNEASVSYREGDFTNAVASLTKALENTGRDLAQAAYYNLGNVYYQTGELEKAAQAYVQALRIEPDDTDAKHNLELALRRQQEQKQQAQQTQASPQKDTQSTPGAQSTQQAQEGPSGDSGKDGSPTPSAQQGSGATPTGETQPTPSAPSSPQDEGPTLGATAQALQGLTPEQAQQLLESVSRDSQSLQDFLRERTGSPVDATGENW